MSDRYNVIEKKIRVDFIIVLQACTIHIYTLTYGDVCTHTYVRVGA